MGKVKLTDENVVRPEIERELEESKRHIELLEARLTRFSQQERHYEIPCGKEDQIEFGIVSDTQFGSLYARTDALKRFYELCGEHGIKTILHGGDVLDGHKMYRGQEFEQHALGYQAQLECFLERRPDTDIKTHFIIGNHDTSYKKQSSIISFSMLLLIIAFIPSSQGF